MNEEGRLQVLLGRLNERDSYGNVFLSGSIGRQVCSVFTGHNIKEPPNGKAWIREVGDKIVGDVLHNLGSEQGRRAHQVAVFDLENGGDQEWDFAFTKKPGGSRSGYFDGDRATIFEALPDGSPAVEIYDVSSVIASPIRGTRTLGKKRRMTEAEELEDRFAKICGRIEYEKTRATLERLDTERATREALKIEAALEGRLYREAFDVDEAKRSTAREIMAKLRRILDIPLEHRWYKHAPASSAPSETFEGGAQWRGFVRPDEAPDLWIRNDVPLEELPFVIAHEARHRAQVDSKFDPSLLAADASHWREVDADRFGELFTKAFKAGVTFHPGGVLQATRELWPVRQGVFVHLEDTPGALWRNAATGGGVHLRREI